MASARTRRLRWSAPLLVAAVIAAIAAVPGLSAAASPSLAPITAQQLIVKVQQANVTAMSGKLNLTTNLGIPNLGALNDAAGGGGHGSRGFTPTDLLSGSHQALIWLSGQNAHVALLQSMAETDVIHSGHDIWLWDSTTKKVTHYTVAAQPGGEAADPAATANKPAEPVKTPQQVATDLLAHLSPSTSVSVDPAVVVAKQKAYQLVLTPKLTESTVSRVVISVDSVTGLPLKVETFAKGQKAAAVSIGFSSIDYSKPAASHFHFTPPPGSTVTNKTLGGAHQGATSAEAKPAGPAAASANQQTTVGQDWTSVAIFHNVTIPKQFNQYLQAGSSVSGTFGSGKLLSTPLVNVLVLDDGRVAVGAVNVGALEAAVASAH